MKSIIAAIAALAAVASAQTSILSVTSPLQGTTWTAGSSATITWINPSVDTISKIVLAHGESTALQQVQVIAENVSAADGSYTWTVPADLAPGTDYALEFGTSPDLAYSPQFTIASGSSSGSASGSSSAASTESSAAASGASSSAASSAAVSSAASSAAASSAATSAAASSAGSSAGSSSASASASQSSTTESGAGKVQPVALAAAAVVGAAAIMF
ncbi:Ser-Thr-rich glycosyl-phosphatidyl-inositol-anchored membrane family-domain-containing protein [Syncephalastrum racemosum]|uniref:Ser-Thr-rich glycosyl-phosphatidyl-inositol-anchored membrane family-domain-containing protein n=1 Tax=Syncephalastrum racemosum TaxID=13706 RepID=A0A1X2HKY3_SYNRA|nr:Ser-Thr-rich glycosyl-phosphatidyl-inositol-anchored membrane family-domain-containing protein [Syncephalastrum racemosum]